MRSAERAWRNPAAAVIRFLRRGAGVGWEAYAARLAEAAATAPPASTLQELIDLRRSVTLKDGASGRRERTSAVASAGGAAPQGK
jgi:hypothetical protein